MSKLGAAVVLLLLHSSGPAALAQSAADCRGRIVFDSERPGPRKADLYVVDSDGSAERQLTFATQPEEFSRTPDLSPDGDRLIFQGNRGQGWGLYVMHCSGGDVVRLVDVVAGQPAQPAWSPDGRQIAFAQSGAIFIVEADGSNVRKIESLPDPSSGPSWSPDGKHIAFVSKGAVTWEIFAVELGSALVRQLTRTTNASISSQGPAWSPDGSKISFDRAQDGNFDIYVMNADGTGIVRLTQDQGVDARPAWSPDGRSIVFHSTRDRPQSATSDDFDFFDLYVMTGDGSNVRRLTSNQYFDGHPTWGRLPANGQHNR